MSSPVLEMGGPGADISDDELDEALDRLVRDSGRPGRVLLVPPDHTRTYGRAGPVTSILHRRFTGMGCDVAVLPALGTHRPMTPDQITAMFGPSVPPDRVLQHRWRDGVIRVGEIAAADMAELSGGAMTESVPVDISETLLGGWDLIVSVGQVVPHEVIGMANFTKNLVIGLGGAEMISRSHLLGALCNMESIMGRPVTPVRTLVDMAFDRLVADRVRVLWVLTVVENTDAGVAHRGLFAGYGGSTETGGAAYLAAASLAARCNITTVAAPLDRVVCWVDPDEFATTWLANKAVYRTRMALADGAELVLLAPGVSRFGEDEQIDRLVRRHGYRGTPATLAAIAADPELADNLGAAAHLIHGSSEGRFDVVYCTSPETGGLTPEEVHQVGYKWRPLDAELALLGVDPVTPNRVRVDRAGSPFYFINRPALGLWTTAGALTGHPRPV